MSPAHHKIVSEFCMRLKVVPKRNGGDGNGEAVHSVTWKELNNPLAKDCLSHWSAAVLLDASSKQRPGKVKPFHQWRMTLLGQEEAETFTA